MTHYWCEHGASVVLRCSLHTTVVFGGFSNQHKDTSWNWQFQERCRGLPFGWNVTNSTTKNPQIMSVKRLVNDLKAHNTNCHILASDSLHASLAIDISCCKVTCIWVEGLLCLFEVFFEEFSYKLLKTFKKTNNNVANQNDESIIKLTVYNK